MTCPLVFVMNMGTRAVPAAPLIPAEVESCDERQSGSPSADAERPTGLEVFPSNTEERLTPIAAAITTTAAPRSRLRRWRSRASRMRASSSL